MPSTAEKMEQGCRATQAKDETRFQHSPCRELNLGLEFGSRECYHLRYSELKTSQLLDNECEQGCSRDLYLTWPVLWEVFDMREQQAS